jgi:hypothetical protein
LAHGGFAVSLTNLTRFGRRLRVRLADVGATGPVEVTDAWRLEPLGERTEVRAHLAGHSSALFVCRPPS